MPRQRITTDWPRPYSVEHADLLDDELLVAEDSALADLRRSHYDLDGLWDEDDVDLGWIDADSAPLRRRTALH